MRLSLVPAALLPVLALGSLDGSFTTQGKLYFGTTVDPDSLAIPTISQLAAQEFGAVTPENSMKWDATEATQGVFTFDNADQTVAFAKQNNQLIRGHALVWHSQLPAWVSELTSADALTAAIETHISTVVGRFRGNITHWDVVNEMWNDDGSIRDSVFSRLLGTNFQFVRLAFDAAKKADPDAKLYINDFNLDAPGPKVDAMVAMVKQLRGEGVPIDGIGSQAHLLLGMGAGIKEPLQQLADAADEIVVTELDIRIQTPGSQENLNQQKKDYEDVVRACVEIQKCVGLSVWGVTDEKSWIPSTFPGFGEALLFDVQGNEKGAYEGALAGMAAAAAEAVGQQEGAGVAAPVNSTGAESSSGNGGFGGGLAALARAMVATVAEAVKAATVETR